MPELLTGIQAAERLGICERTLRKLRQSGAIAYIALTTRTIRYTPEDCDAYLASCRRQDTPAALPTPKGAFRAPQKGASFMGQREARRASMRKRTAAERRSRV